MTKLARTSLQSKHIGPLVIDTVGVKYALVLAFSCAFLACSRVKVFDLDKLETGGSPDTLDGSFRDPLEAESLLKGDKVNKPSDSSSDSMMSQ